MTLLEPPVSSARGARFFDERKQDRGLAQRVTQRSPGVGRLTVLDVVTTDGSLTKFLVALDKSPLRVECVDVSGESYTFDWASGYENGTQIRIQGVLVGS